MANTKSAGAAGKKRVRRIVVVLVALLVLLGAGAVFMAMAAAAHKKLTDGCTATNAIDTAAASSIATRVPLGQTYVVATTSTPTELDLAPTDSSGNAAAGPVLASQAGTITAVTVHSITIDQGQGVVLTYGGLAKTSVTKGAKVGVGQSIGTLNAGDMVKLTLTQNGAAANPRTYLTSAGVTLDGTKPPAPLGQSERIATGSTGAGFNLPAPGDPRQDSIHNNPIPVPADLKADYQAAGQQYGLPWTLLAGIGMEETAQGENESTSSAGAQGLMQMLPTTFAAYAVDGNGDGKTDITNDADSIFTAAHYLVASGATQGSDGVRKALYAYNHADWYVNDVLFYAQAYGGGNVTATAANMAAAGCTDAEDTATNLTIGPVSPGQLATNIQALANGYPAWTGGGTVDPGHWFSGECVSWAGYFVRTMYPSKYGTFNNAYKGATFGDAATWRSGAVSAGLPIDSTPAVGSIAVRTYGTFGHVAAVIAVNRDGTFTVAEYNFSQHHQFDIRTDLSVGPGADQFDYFIHFEK